MVKRIGIFITILGLFFVGIPQFNTRSYASEYTPVYSDNNLLIPDLKRNEYLGDGWFNIFNRNDVDLNYQLDYNIYSGVFRENGEVYNVVIQSMWFDIVLINNDVDNYAFTYIPVDVSGRLTESNLFSIHGGSYGGWTLENTNYNNQYSSIITPTRDTGNFLRYSFQEGTYNNVMWKLQIEKGTEATSYTVPLQPYLWHEKQQSYNEGYSNGYNEGWQNAYDLETTTIGNLNYAQGGSSEFFNVGFSLPIHDTLTYELNHILRDVKDAFGINNKLALFIVKQEANYQFEYRLLNSSYSVIEVMPKFDTIMFLAETDEMAILLNGDIIKYYNNTMGIDRLELVYTGIYDDNDYQGGYLQGYNDGLINGSTTGYAEGYTEARRELWTSRYELGYNDGQVIGYENGLIDGEIIGYEKGLIATDATGFGALLGAVFGGLGVLLGIEILPGIYIGAIFAVPLVFGIIFFILGKKKE